MTLNVVLYAPRIPRRCPVCRTAAFQPLFPHRDMLHGIGGEFTIVRCRDCGLVSYDPFPDDQTLATYYPRDYYAHLGANDQSRDQHTLKERARRLLDDVHLGLRRNPLLFLMLLPLLWYKESYSYARFLRPVRRGRLLDVGCGDGAFLMKARRMGFECHGLEPGRDPRDFPSVEGIVFHACTLEDLGGHEGFFDVITLHHVFEHLAEPERALRKLRGLLAPGGRVLIRMPRTDQFMFRRFPRAWFSLDTPRHVYLYTPENFKRLATRCGFKLDACIPECVPLSLTHALKVGLFRRRRFSDPYWLDAGWLGFALLPLCALLKRIGQADWMALWLSKDDE